MADDDKVLVERLRANDTEIYLPILGEAADRIEDLSAESERLREAMWAAISELEVGAKWAAQDILRAALGETK